MTRLAIAMSLLIASLPASAQTSKQSQACFDKAMTQTAMNICAGEEAKQADSELNAAYHAILLKAASNTEAVAKIKTMERNWVAYRDTYMEALYPAKDKFAEYGSIYPTNAALARSSLTNQQTAALKQILKQYNNQANGK